MKTQLISTPKEKIDSGAVVLFLHEEQANFSDFKHSFDPSLVTLIEECYTCGEFKGESFEVTLIHQPAGFCASRLLLVGLGKDTEMSAARVRQGAGSAVRFATKRGIQDLALVPPSAIDSGDAVQALIEGALLGTYEPDAYQTQNKNVNNITTLTVLSDEKWAKRFDAGVAIADAQNFTRTLVNEPGNILTPNKLAEKAHQMALAAGLDVEILDHERIRELGMGSLLGVAQGSAEMPTMTIVKYAPDNPTPGIHLGLVGKAVTFDTGGISIKPATDMGRMKYDMAGGAAMLGAMKALARLKPQIPVTAVVPSVENMLGPQAQRPGDVVTSMSGKTIEVLNTDAEGRLILADALTYAQKLGCTHLVDAATLTGAIVIALGHERVGAFTNSDEWLSRVTRTAETVGEKFWAMPLDSEYKKLIESPIADLANIGPRWGGAITAAMFLKEFADPLPWVHLDIAGTAWLEEEKPYLAAGPSGIPVRALIALAMDL
tara:strand:+ start:67732 stop:69201 length:1470 start_codon:yes stop_codon:yes gene_type:complete